MAAILDYRSGLAARVQQEIEEATAGRPIDGSFAESIAKGASRALGNENGDSSEEFSLLNVAIGICLQADVNRDVALALLK